MKVATFYKSCKESALYDSLQGSNPHLEFASAVRKGCELMSKGFSQEALLPYLKGELETNIKSEWFRFSFQKEQIIADALKKFQRFLNWLNNTGKYNIIKANICSKVSVLNYTLEQNVHLLIEREDCSYEGIVINTGTNAFSFKGKSTHTQAVNSLYSLVPKYFLEEEGYKNVIITNVYLTNDNDTLGNIDEHFLITNSKGSNVHRFYFEQYYHGGEWDCEELFCSLTKIVSEPVKKNCYMCFHQGICNSQTLANKPTEESVEREYSLPSFTPSQEEVVNHEKGPMLVIAGPGSGKTAALVGRIHALMKKGIDTDYMLVITFTKEAAKELRQRCLSFCEEKSLPTITTIHAICYQILKDNKDLIGVEYELLTTQNKLKIVEGLLEAFPVIKGLNYNVVSGNFGLLKTVARKLEEYLVDRDAFLEKEKELGEDFIELAECFSSIMKAHHYISFDEQVSKCNEFLKEYPEIRDSYNAIYQYLMVDEFQDINSDQAEFIQHMSLHQNIVAVGDDDQNIYEFRGGSNKYMLNFGDYYPSYSKVEFKENFRSTEALATACCSLINKNNMRIKKEQHAVRKGGNAPIYVNGNSCIDVEKAIEEALDKGYSYRDIAVLSQKNATLEELKEHLKYPCILEKAYLINEPLFVAAFYSLALIKSEYKDNMSLLRLCKLFSVPLENARQFGVLYDSIRSNKDDSSISLLEFIDIVNGLPGYSATEYIRAIAYTLGLEGTKAHAIINELILSNELSTQEELFKKFDEMIVYEDDTKVSISNADAVLLITNHESKGKEFPVVILVGDSEPTTEDATRVLYVAMTRAENLLYVLNNATPKVVTA